MFVPAQRFLLFCFYVERVHLTNDTNIKQLGDKKQSRLIPSSVSHRSVPLDSFRTRRTCTEETLCHNQKLVLSDTFISEALQRLTRIPQPKGLHNSSWMGLIYFVLPIWNNNIIQNSTLATGQRTRTDMQITHERQKTFTFNRQKNSTLTCSFFARARSDFGSWKNSTKSNGWSREKSAGRKSTFVPGAGRSRSESENADSRDYNNAMSRCGASFARCIREFPSRIGFGFVVWVIWGSFRKVRMEMGKIINEA